MEHQQFGELALEALEARTETPTPLGDRASPYRKYINIT